MKKEFSTSWNSSTQPRKQRKYLHNAPLHVLRKSLNSMLDKPLRAKYGRKSIEVRKGDEVKVMRGEFKKRQGKIDLVKTAKGRVAIENMQITRKDGTKANVWFVPSNLKIIVLNMNDKKRMPERKKAEIKAAAPAKPAPVEKKMETKKTVKEAKK